MTTGTRWQQTCAAYCLLALAACSVRLPDPLPSEEDSAGASATEANAASEGNVDAGVGAYDAEPVDAPLPPHPDPQAPPPSAPACSDAALPGTIAWLRFEDSLADGNLDNTVAASPSARIVGDGLVHIEGPEGCGRAIRFPENQAEGEERSIELPASPVWNLEEGSLDFWMWSAAAKQDQRGVGLIARERDHSGTLRLRYQPKQPRLTVLFSRTGMGLRSSLPREQWVHVGINFGGTQPELYINGSLQASAQLLESWGMTSEDKWIIGKPVRGPSSDTPFVGGAIDEFRISRVRQDFSALFGR